MQEFLSRHNISIRWVIQWIGILTLVSVMIWSLDILSVLIEPRGYILNFLTVFVCAFRLSPFLIALLIFGLVYKNTRLLSIRVTFLLLLFICVFMMVAYVYGPISNKIAERVQVLGFEPFLDENMVIVGSIREYEKEHGYLPRSLSELTPDYLTTIPEEFIGIPFDYEYETSPMDEKWRDNSWILTLRIPVRYFDDAIFVYASDQVYPDDVEIINQWGFLGTY